MGSFRQARFNTQWSARDVRAAQRYDIWSAGVVLLEVLALGSPQVVQLHPRTRITLDMRLKVRRAARRAARTGRWLPKRTCQSCLGIHPHHASSAFLSSKPSLQRSISLGTALRKRSGKRPKLSKRLHAPSRTNIDDALPLHRFNQRVTLVAERRAAACSLLGA
jgi:hypothetical protein